MGDRDTFDLRFWENLGEPAVLEMWGRVNYSLAVVIAEGCAIDKEFNILHDRHLAAGLSPGEAVTRALEEADPFIAVAEAWPVDVLPAHVQGGAESGAVGYVPFRLSSIRADEERVFAVDLSRPSSISWRAIHRRIAIGDSRWVQQIQVGLCRFFAARSIRVNEDLASLFQHPVDRVESLGPPQGNPPRVRARFYLANGRNLDVEAILQAAAEADAEGAQRPGFRPTR